MIRNFIDLQIYKRSKILYARVISVTRQFPRDGKYLSSQTDRAANSIHSNIAEGFGRSVSEFKNYLTRSLGSNNEILSHLEDALTAKYISQKQFQELYAGYTILGKQIYRLRERWKQD
ncbi:four helix bundle protein [Candidatus Kaiserbacteria bacterium]|nr:four helix bundle protein [Candidatus Kaiserbacteria bacterium]